MRLILKKLSLINSWNAWRNVTRHNFFCISANQYLFHNQLYDSTTDACTFTPLFLLILSASKWNMRNEGWLKGGGKVISTTTPLFPSKQRIYISDRTDNTGHCLTKIWLTQPLPACFVRQSGSRADRARRGWVSPIFIRRWPALSLLSLIYILSF